MKRLAAVAALVVRREPPPRSPPTTVLPKPAFPAAATGPGSNTRHVPRSSSAADRPGAGRHRAEAARAEDRRRGRNHPPLRLRPNYTFDFRNYARAPRTAPGEREFTYQQVVWAHEAPTGVLYVETAHSTYAKSSYGRNGYISAIDLKKRKLLWRSPALVANAPHFVLLNNTIVSGYGFTAEPDYLYAIDRATGKIKGRLLVPSAPRPLPATATSSRVTTYDHRLVIRVTAPDAQARRPDPQATVWVGPREQHTIEEIVEDGPVLLLFYLFDWTST